jgi:hypothetical protein
LGSDKEEKKMFQSKIEVLELKVEELSELLQVGDGRY